MSTDCPAFYRSRTPRESPVFRLVENGYEKVKGIWDDRFESSYGFWRSFVEDTIFAFLGCGDFEQGYAVTD